MKIEYAQEWTPPHEAKYPTARSLFGKHPFPIEQALIVKFMTEVDHTAMVIIPEVAAPYGAIFVERVALARRREKAHEHLWKAKQLLEEIGV